MKSLMVGCALLLLGSGVALAQNAPAPMAGDYVAMHRPMHHGGHRGMMMHHRGMMMHHKRMGNRGMMMHHRKMMMHHRHMMHRKMM